MRCSQDEVGMSVAIASNCLTRVVVDDRNIEIAQLQAAVHRIQEALPNVPATQREYIANALLNLAVSKILKKRAGAQTVASTLGLRPELS
jgi:hypothetical protein